MPRPCAIHRVVIVGQQESSSRSNLAGNGWSTTSMDISGQPDVIKPFYNFLRRVQAVFVRGLHLPTKRTATGMLLLYY